jgi:DNA-binding XRE family transcriptional regulator
MTREQLSGIIGYAPRHIQSIENEGQYPSIELFIQLITMFPARQKRVFSLFMQCKF